MGELEYDKDVTIFMDYVADKDFNGGTSETTVKIQNQKIFQTKEPVDCKRLKMHNKQGISKYLPQLQIPCPMHKGQHIKVKGVRIPFKPPFPIPAGTYQLEVKTRDFAGNLFMCLQLN